MITVLLEGGYTTVINDMTIEEFWEAADLNSDRLFFVRDRNGSNVLINVRKIVSVG